MFFRVSCSAYGNTGHFTILSGWRLNTDKFHSPTTTPESAGAGGPGLQNRRRWPDESQIPQPAPTGRNQHFPGPGEELPTLRNRLHNIRELFSVKPLMKLPLKQEALIQPLNRLEAEPGKGIPKSRAIYQAGCPLSANYQPPYVDVNLIDQTKLYQ